MYGEREESAVTWLVLGERFPSPGYLVLELFTGCRVYPFEKDACQEVEFGLRQPSLLLNGGSVVVELLEEVLRYAKVEARYSSACLVLPSATSAEKTTFVSTTSCI